MRLTEDDKGVVNMLILEVVSLRDAAARLAAAMREEGINTGAIDQLWQRYAHAETVLVELRDAVD